jgi:predicted phage baseplate assembly protein
MNQLAPVLFDRRYADLVEAARSRLPSLAPNWTDYNAHDPGITLIELLAWITEAQIYSLARSRRDERSAYAALMGIFASGTQPAQGMIWPDHSGSETLGAIASRPFVIEQDSVVHTTSPNTPVFRPLHKILWIPAQIQSLTTRLADGTKIDRTQANKLGGQAFQPFGKIAGPKDAMIMELHASGKEPLFPTKSATDARLVIGVRTEVSRNERSKLQSQTTSVLSNNLDVTLVTDNDRMNLPIVEDTSNSLIRTGYCALDISAVRTEALAVKLEFRSREGFDRPPRILRIEPNAIPVIQSEKIVREIHVSKIGPNQDLTLDRDGLQYDAPANAIELEVDDGDGFKTWKRCERLSDQGPDDFVYELAINSTNSKISFGNGINGRKPVSGGTIAATYLVSLGSEGNTARNRVWKILGISGTYGINYDPIVGGQYSSGWMDQRRIARKNLNNPRALVSSADIEDAARKLPTLEVVRAWVIPTGKNDIDKGAVKLLAMQERREENQSKDVFETDRWLRAVQRSLAPRILLGSRLTVIGPRYVKFSLRMQIRFKAGVEANSATKMVRDELIKRMALANPMPGYTQRPFGLSVTRRDISAWLKALSEVEQVETLYLILANGKTSDEVKVPRDGLPLLNLEQSTIEAVRNTSGAPR